MIRAKSITLNINEITLADYYINSFIKTFNLELVDVKIVNINEKEINFIVLFDCSYANSSLYPEQVEKFICGAGYDPYEECWYNDGITEDTAKALFKVKKIKDSIIYVQ